MTIRPFRPAWWLPGAHAQTVGGRFLRRFDVGEFRSERIELPDGDFVDIHESETGLQEDAPRALVLHGLEGSSRSNYVATVARELERVGFRALRLNFRACSGEMNRLPRFYHAGETEDLHHVVRHLRQRSPGVPLAVIGFSLGGNVLLKYLGERGEQARDDLLAAVAVSVPFDLAAGTRRLEEGGMSRIYTRYFIQKLRSKVNAKRHLLAERCDVERAGGVATIREYDELITAPMHGFRDAWHYYETCSSSGWLDGIRLPTAILHSVDDPFLPSEAVPTGAVRRNPWIVDGIVPRGGHVGFVEGTPWNPGFWAESEAARFLHRIAAAPPADPAGEP
jgi:uncharacterized protein